MVDGLQEEYSDRMTFVVYADVDADMEVSEFAYDRGVVFVPTMILAAPDGTELNRWEGAIPESVLRAAFDVNLE